MIKPKALKKGDTIAIAAPSSWFDPELLSDGIAALESAGFKIIYRKDISNRHYYLAGTDARRAAELNQYLQDPVISAIFFARGGYGAQRILPLLQPPSTPKIVLGYSDATILHAWLQRQCSTVSFYGPCLSHHLSKSAPAENFAHLLKAVTSTQALGAMPMGESVVVKPGNASGRLLGGCMTLLQMAAGTSYDVDTRDAILLLEDRGEKLYEIDRMLTHLKHAGKLNVRGIIFGSMILHPNDEARVADLIPILQEVLADFSGPVIAHYPAGHTDPFVTLPLGVEATLSTSPLQFTITEAACLSP